MVGQSGKSARAIAAAVLNQFDPRRDYAGTILDKLIGQTGEKQRATDLVFGTIRNTAAIDTAITKLADCRAERIPADLLNIIRIAAYELIYCPQTPAYSIVNEAVENAGTIAGKKQVGFVNAVLRQISRHITNRQIALAEAEPQKTLPQTPLTGCEFDTDILPQPKLSPADYFSIAFSLPKWLVADWIAEFGFEKTRQICFAGNRKAGIYIRVNTLKTTVTKLVEHFRQADIDFELISDETMVKVKSPAAIDKLPGFTEGLFSIQDITAAQVVRALEPRANWTILDLCAAPGVKTTQLAELTGDKAAIFATDIDDERLQKVRQNSARLGIKSISIVKYENLKKKAAEVGAFDCILLDVPCSNTGVLSKRPEVRYRIKPKAITKLTKTQGRLLEYAATMIKPQGKICYSTCSLQPDENGRLVEQFLLQNQNFKLESERLWLPSAEGFGRDGGYVAIITGK